MQIEPEGTVYFIGVKDAASPIKVGWTGVWPEKRLAALQISHWEPLSLIGEIAGSRDLERFAHKVLDRWRVTGEWFEREPALDLLIDFAPYAPIEDPAKEIPLRIHFKQRVFELGGRE